MYFARNGSPGMRTVWAISTPRGLMWGVLFSDMFSPRVGCWSGAFYKRLYLISCYEDPEQKSMPAVTFVRGGGVGGLLCGLCVWSGDLSGR
ncbi:hypothetical protein GCM10025785_11690 [Corynebacterium canis]